MFLKTIKYAVDAEQIIEEFKRDMKHCDDMIKQYSDEEITKAKYQFLKHYIETQIDDIERSIK